ncbi:hypothetical protein MN608_06957 [Microdochium nivale]|nr:hypothetical protein MN608_06957 [Microdochium nivale]
MAASQPQDKGKNPANQHEATTSGGANEQSDFDGEAQSFVQHAPGDEAAPPALPPRPSPSNANDNHKQHQVIAMQPLQQYRQPTAKELALQPYTHELRLLPPYNKTFSRIKLWLAMLLFAWGASMTTISAIILPEYLSILRPVGPENVCFFGIPFGLIDMIWNAAEVLTLCARGSDSIYPRGIHPGAHVGVHLVMWVCSIIGIVLGSITISNYDQAERLCRGGDEFNGFYWQFCRGWTDNRSTFRYLLDYVAALLAASCIMLLLHFTLFVWACVDTHHRNRLSLGRHFAAPHDTEARFDMQGPPKVAPLQLMQEPDLPTRSSSADAPAMEDKVLQHPHNPTRHLGHQVPGQAATEPHVDQVETSGGGQSSSSAVRV